MHFEGDCSYKAAQLHKALTRLEMSSDLRTYDIRSFDRSPLGGLSLLSSVCVVLECDGRVLQIGGSTWCARSSEEVFVVWCLGCQASFLGTVQIARRASKSE